MAYENIELQKPNFCFGPQEDTICSVDTTNVDTVLRVKDTSGANLLELSMASNIVSDVVRLEYVGPRGLTSMPDKTTFFTFERISSSRCIIKRWQVRLFYLELLLKEEVIKQTSGDEYYDSSDFAVEYHATVFTRPGEYYNYIDVLDDTNIKAGTKLFLGPSTDADNYGETEHVVAHYVTDFMGGKRVYLDSYTTNQYVIGDPITYYSYVYIYSAIGHGGDSDNGSLYKIDTCNWQTKEVDSKAFYKYVTAVRWCPSVRAVASIIGTNMLFVSPYNYYLNWKSMFMNNVHQNKIDTFSVYDVIFDNYSVYKLQDKITKRFDDGGRTTSTWTTYNYQEDTLLPYTNSAALSKSQTILTGYHKYVDINVKVRDQFHTGLRDVRTEFSVSGDSEAVMSPSDGVVVTDFNGHGVIGYTSGSTYNGHTEVSAMAVGGSTATGSSYVWAYSNVISLPSFTTPDKPIIQLKELSAVCDRITQLSEQVEMNFALRGKSFFTTPGGDWGPYENDYVAKSFCSPGITQQYLPMLYQGSDQIDGALEGSFEVERWPYGDSSVGFIGNQLRLVEDFESEFPLTTLSEFEVEASVIHPDETFSRLLSQLKLGHHTHWVDGEPYDYLWTYDTVDQFVFVEDAVPQFWSEKNPIASDIWIRLRPFAFSLNADTLRMWVREVSFVGDTGDVEVTDSVTITGFDAGGNILGLEVDYDRTIDFHYDAIVFVKIEVYDTSAIPNYIFVNYWFKITPDYDAPYLLNLQPDREDSNVAVDDTIYLEIKDDGTGIDITTLELFLNSIRMKSEDLNIEVVSDYHLKITYTPPEDLYFGKNYRVTVKVKDLTPNDNILNDSYRFYTAESNGVIFVDPLPGLCKRGMSRFEDVSVIVLPTGTGVDGDTITMQVFNKNVDPAIIPILYRIS